MRCLSKPISGTASGKALSTSHEPPGRSGASHSSQTTLSSIRPSRLPTASQRVASTEWLTATGSASGVAVAGCSAAVMPGWVVFLAVLIGMASYRA